MWLCIDDIAWHVKWLSDELRSGGVPIGMDDPLDAFECNCEADNVHIRWDFDGAWEAIVLESANRGTTVKPCVLKCDVNKWLSIVGDARYGTGFGSATSDQLKAATRHLLQQHMQEVVCPQLRA